MNKTTFLNIMSAVFTFLMILVALSTAFGVRISSLGPYRSTVLFAVCASAVCVAGWQITNALASFKLRRRLFNSKLNLISNNELDSMNFALPVADISNIASSPKGKTENIVLKPILKKTTDKFEL